MDAEARRLRRAQARRRVGRQRGWAGAMALALLVGGAALAFALSGSSGSTQHTEEGAAPPPELPRGGRPNKISRYREFTRGRRGAHNGFKLFYEEDTGLMRPRDVLRLRPRPELVVYE